MELPLSNRVKEAVSLEFMKYVTERRKLFIDRVLGNRTRHITVVLEDIYQSQNASAVLRTCECLGVQDVHVIENKSTYGLNKKVLKGANKWIDLNRYRDRQKDNTPICYEALRKQGYTIVATVPDQEAVPYTQLDVSTKMALVFGNELEGLTPYAIEQADIRSTIPLSGFTESFNLSVTAAIYLSTLLNTLRHSDVAWQLTDEEKMNLRLGWLRKSVRNASTIERVYLQSIG